ncbi:hypothetical protein HYC85_004868 [Camellia sinensis]|uniref:RING-CH-type domain-containing protein n=1 Tax=Camellia sinensis TaxID=4442 RepID=A0A7J7HXS4_CAMSI|nr:hypothetical protein HYC85_004868 [Camellia sinensis]
MSDHLVLCVDRLITSESLQSLQGAEVSGSSSGEGSCSHTTDPSSSIDMKDVEEHDEADEEEPLIQMVECRICQEEDSIQNLETPCACSGSLKFAHRKCVQRWCNEKGDITCEICHQHINLLSKMFSDIQPYQPGYTAPPPSPGSDDTTIDINGAWTISGSPLDLRDPRILAMAAAERHLLDADYDEYADTNANGAAFCRSAALILMALLLLRHALTIGNGEDDDDDASTFFSVSGMCSFLAAGCWFSSPMLHYGLGYQYIATSKTKTGGGSSSTRRNRSCLHDTRSAQRRGLQFTIAPGAVGPVPAATPGSVMTPGQAVSPHE